MNESAGLGITQPEYLARSSKGVWVKAEFVDDQINVLWQPRYVTDGGDLCTLDANGDVEKRVPVAEGRYDEPYRIAGTIPIVDDTVEFCGLPHVNEFLFGLMRHAVCLILGGWGDTPEEVVGWFSDINKLDFLQEGEYQVVGPEREPFVGIGDCKIVTSFGDEGKFIARIHVKNNQFDHVMEGHEAITAFVISTIPAI